MKSLRLNARYLASLPTMAACVLLVVLISWPASADDDVLVGALRRDNLTSKSPEVETEQARNTGMDIAGVYSTFAPSWPGECVLSDCVASDSNYWGRATNAGFPFVPNVTLRWDSRPRDSYIELAHKLAQGEEEKSR